MKSTLISSRRAPSPLMRGLLRRAVQAGLVLLGACAAVAAPAAAMPNVLLVIIDDVGPEQLGAYKNDGIANANPASTPNLDALAASGVRFRNAWGFPVCSPSRAAMYTGRYPLRTGVGAVIESSSDATLSKDETTLADLVGNSGASSALIGKWHLGENTANGGTDAPRQAGGFGKHSGILGGAVSSYTSWIRYLNGSKIMKPVTDYATTYQVNDAYNFANTNQQWMISLGLVAPHSPYHKPTSGLYVQDLSAVSSCDSNLVNRRKCYKAALEAADSELGRLLTQLNNIGQLANTTVIVVGDNGTPSNAVDAGVDSSKAKGTVYQRGVRVPMIISGANVVNGGRVLDDLVSVTDVFATIAALRGQTADSGVDSVSMLPYLDNSAGQTLRSYVYTETFTGSSVHNGSAAVRDARYKLIESGGSYIGFYDLQNDPEESNNLLNTTLDATAEASLANLKAEFDRLHNH